MTRTEYLEQVKAQGVTLQMIYFWYTSRTKSIKALSFDEFTFFIDMWLDNLVENAVHQGVPSLMVQKDSIKNIIRTKVRDDLDRHFRILPVTINNGSVLIGYC